LEPEERFAFDNLAKRRQIVKQETQKTITVNMTEDGKSLLLALNKPGAVNLDGRF